MGRRGAELAFEGPGGDTLIHLPALTAVGREVGTGFGGAVEPAATIDRHLCAHQTTARGGARVEDALISPRGRGHARGLGHARAHRSSVLGGMCACGPVGYTDDAWSPTATQPHDQGIPRPRSSTGSSTTPKRSVCGPLRTHVPREVVVHVMVGLAAVKALPRLLAEAGHVRVDEVLLVVRVDRHLDASEARTAHGTRCSAVSEKRAIDGSENGEEPIAAREGMRCVRRTGCSGRRGHCVRPARRTTGSCSSTCTTHSAHATVRRAHACSGECERGRVQALREPWSATWQWSVR
jgi:hypothetical protein